MARDRLRRAAPVAVPLLLIVVLLGPHLMGLRSLAPTDQLYGWEPWRSERPAELTPTHAAPFSDNFDGIFPAREELVQRMRDGDWPLWSPRSSGGSDLAIAIGSGAAAPSQLVALATPGWYTPALLKALELLGAFGFVFLFLRRVGTGRWGATVAGAVFALSGFQVVWVNWPHTRVSMLVAGVLWAFDRVIERPSPERVATASVVMAATILEGFPAVAVVGIGAVALVLAVRLLQQSDSARDALRRSAPAAGAAMLGGALTAIVIVPFASRLSTFGLDRGVPPDAPIARGLGTALAPNALGPAESWFGPLNYIEVVGFIGGPALLLAAAGCAAVALSGRPGRRDVLLVVVTVGGAIMLAYSFGVEPLYDLFRGLPVLSTNPAMRVKAAALLLLALASGLGLDRLLRSDATVRARVAVSVVVTAVALLFVGYLWGFVGGATPELRDYVRGEVVRAVVVTSLAALAVLAIVHRWPRPQAPRVAASALLGLVVVDALVWVLPYWPRSEPEEFYPVTDAHEFLSGSLEDERFAALGLTFFPGTSSYYGLRSALGHVFFRESWVDALGAAGATMRSPTFATFEDPASASSPILDRLGTAYWAEAAGVIRCDPDAAPSPTTARPVASDTVRVTAEGPGVRGLLVTPEQSLPAGTELTLRAVSAGGDERVAVRRLGGASTPGEPLLVAVPRLEEDRGAVELTLDGDRPLGMLATPAAACMAGDDGLTLVHADGTWIYRRDDALERARWASEAVVEADSAARLDLLSSGELPDTTVVLDEPLDGPSTGGDGQVVEFSDDADTVRLTTQSDGPGLAVIADPLQEGWVATVDGDPVEIVAADHAGVAVAVPEGRHEVVLSYRPPGQLLGAVISGLAAIGVIGLYVVAWVTSRRRRGIPAPSSRSRHPG